MIQSSSAALQQQQTLAGLAKTQDNTAAGAGSASASTSNGATASSLVTISQKAYKLLASSTSSTSADRAAPKVTKFTPADNSKKVTLTANITLTFSESIQRGSGNLVLKKADGTVIETFDAATSQRLKISGSSLKIDPTQKLENGTRYYLTFDAGVVTDKVGNAVKGNTSYDFTTLRERVAPKVTSFFPADGASNISTTQPIQIVFSEAIKRGTGDILIRDVKGKLLETIKASSSRLAIDDRSLVITPGKKFATDTKYTVTIAAGVVKDLAGNSYPGAKSYDFKTAATDLPPATLPTPPSSPAPGSPTAPSSGGGSSGGTSNFNIELNYSGDPQYLTYFQQAKAFWENVITGDLPDINGIDDLRISASIVAIDSAGGVLGSASPTLLRGSTSLPFQGNMQFDSADMANMVTNGTLLGVIKHEMAHVLGIGTLWGNFGFNSTAGRYTGAQALAAYTSIAGGNPAFVPLEDNGGSGTVNAHWEEDIFTTELMTGTANGAMNLSRVTIGALADLGYTVNYSAAQTSGLNLMAPSAGVNLLV